MYDEEPRRVGDGGGGHVRPVFIGGAHGAASTGTSTGTGTPEMYFSANASAHLEETYWPAWKALFLEEGTDSAYPMPAAADTPDLLSALSGVKGIAVNTDPGVINHLACVCTGALY